MNTRLRRKNLLTITAFITALSFTCPPVRAQWVNVPPPAIPRTPDGKPNLSAPAPRLPDGHPDLSGIWEPNGKYVTNLAADLKPEDVPLQPWAKTLFDGRQPAADMQSTWLGYSTGRWDGDTLVVDTRGFNGKGWLDQL